MAQKKYDYVFAPPLLPGLLAAAPMALAVSQNSSEPQKYEGDKINKYFVIKLSLFRTENTEKSNFGTQTFIIAPEEDKGLA